MKFFAKASGKTGEMYLYRPIGPSWMDMISDEMVAAELEKLRGVTLLNIYMNSIGGSVFFGLAIYNQLRRFQAKKIVHVDALAASISSVIALAGDEVHIAANAKTMIHEASGPMFGTADEHIAFAGQLRDVEESIIETYIARTGNKRDDIVAWMKAETWMNAKDSVARGFATKVVEDSGIAVENALMLNQYKNVPAELRQGPVKAGQTMLASMQMRSATLNRGTPARA